MRLPGWIAIGEEARTADCSVCGFGVTVNPGVSHGGDTFGGIPTSTLLASFVVQHARHREIRGRQVASGLTPDGRVTAAAKAVLA